MSVSAQGFEHLLRVTTDTDFQPIYDRLRDQPALRPGEKCASDTVVELPIVAA